MGNQGENNGEAGQRVHAEKQALHRLFKVESQ